jgi:osmotically-inducible protein OsmY
MKHHIKNQAFVFMIMLSIGITQVLSAPVDSKTLKLKVENAISHYYLETFGVKADADGKVILSGSVNSLFDRLRIYEVVAKVPGVTFIENKLAVITPQLPDNIIADNILEQIRQAPSIKEPDRIKVKVTNGLVILSGEVSFYREKIMAETVASWQKGVKGIENDIVLLSSQKARSDENLKIILQEILKNHFPENKAVTFTVQDGVVTLDGKTRLLWDKMKITEEFSKVIGVVKVVDNLEAEPAE